MGFFEGMKAMFGGQESSRPAIKIERPDVTPKEYEEQVLGVRELTEEDRRHAADSRQLDAAANADLRGDHARADAIRQEMKADARNTEPLEMPTADALEDTDDEEQATG